jgi:recombination protein RecA
MAKMRKVRKQTVAEKLLNKPVDQLDMLSAIVGDSNKVVTLDDLQPTPAVPTIFTSFNRAVVLQGAPARATWLLHGPPGGGKSSMALGIATSFVQQGHAAAYIDAEHALEKKWVGSLKTATKGILLERPHSFEAAFDQVDIWIENFARAKEKGNIPPDRLFCIVVDTIHKLAPKREIDALASSKPNRGRATHGGDNINKGWGMLRANMITSWIDHLTPLVSEHGVAFIAVAHEKEEQSDDWGKADYKVKGGQSLMYEAMVRIRVAQGSKQYEKINGKNRIVGQEHNASVEKNKVGHPHEFFKFYTSNGKGKAPAGFDLAKEAVVEAKTRGLLGTGTWIKLPYDRSRKFQGQDNLIQYLRDDEDNYIEFRDWLNDDLNDPDEYDYTNEETETDDE